jgi:hypothetical protein
VVYTAAILNLPIPEPKRDRINILGALPAGKQKKPDPGDSLLADTARTRGKLLAEKHLRGDFRGFGEMERSDFVNNRRQAFVSGFYLAVNKMNVCGVFLINKGNMGYQPISDIPGEVFEGNRLAQFNFFHLFENDPDKFIMLPFMGHTVGILEPFQKLLLRIKMVLNIINKPINHQLKVDVCLFPLFETTRIKIIYHAKKFFVLFINHLNAHRIPVIPFNRVTFFHSKLLYKFLKPFSQKLKFEKTFNEPIF